MANKYVLRVHKVIMSPNASRLLSANAYKEVSAWLTQWTCANNFKAVIGDYDYCINVLRDDLKKNLIPSWLVREGVTPECFVFTVSGGEVSDDDRFWSSFDMVYCRENTI